MEVKTAKDWEKYLSMLSDSELVCIRNRVMWECKKRSKVKQKG